MNDTSPHSEQFIAEMKDKLESEKAQLSKELSIIAHKDNGDQQSNFPEYGRHDEENANEIADYQAQFSTTETIEERLKEVETALERIDSGSYGITADGKTIPEDRLRANPAATTLVNPRA